LSSEERYGCRMRIRVLCLLAATVACSNGSSSEHRPQDGATADQVDASRDDPGEARDAQVADAASDGLDDGGTASDDAGVDAARPHGCRSEPVKVSRADQFVLIIDGSISMEDPLGGSQVSRWTALQDALFGAEGALTTFADPERIAIAIFGSFPACPLPFGLSVPNQGSLAVLEAAFPPAPPGMFTPTDSAIRAVSQRFAATPSTPRSCSSPMGTRTGARLS
jgi:hypothetical protein